MKVSNKVKSIIIFILMTAAQASAQVVYTPADNDVYNFLERLALKDVIEFHNEVRPVARKLIAEKLWEAALKESQLNSTEQKELEWYEEEYAYELNKIMLSFNHSTMHPFNHSNATIQPTLVSLSLQ